MLRFGLRRRTVLVETLRELANLVVGALVIGRIVGAEGRSIALMLSGISAWFLLVGVALLLAGEPHVVDALVIIYGIIFGASIIALLDWLGRRQHRRSKQRPGQP